MVFLTNGVMAKECTIFNNRLAHLICRKTGEEYADDIRHIRTKLRFALLKSTLIQIRGFRGNTNVRDREAAVSDISFNLIPKEIKE